MPPVPVTPLKRDARCDVAVVGLGISGGMIAESLTAAGFTVLAASDPGQAFVICQEHQAKIDLLLTDVIMPGMSGRALWELVRPLRPEMQVLYMSGYSGTAISQHGVLTEGTHLIEKPLLLFRQWHDVLQLGCDTGPSDQF